MVNYFVTVLLKHPDQCQLELKASVISTNRDPHCHNTLSRVRQPHESSRNVAIATRG